MSLFAVSYRYAAGSEAGRDEHRPLHLEFLQGLFDSGQLVVSGPTDPTGAEPGAMLIIRGDSADQVDQLMAQDPFAERGYVERVVREWAVKFGAARLEPASAAPASSAPVEAE
ncbi:YciI family protein [Leucobacter sp. NPDC058333]|uniref:YciI family protein n=1 Tax=Leucobacter sp. NPDC058333 TaxID=3346450 RepID=UPI00364C5AD3